MKKNKITLLILAGFTVVLFQKNQWIQTCILNACSLFFYRVFPSLFPMFILCDCFIYAGFPDLLSHYFGTFFSKVFHTSPYGAFAFFMSLFSGTPANAYIMKQLVLEGKLSSEEASYILSFSFFSNPLFYYTMLNLIFPNSSAVILKLFCAPYLTNLFLGVLTRPSKPKENYRILLHKSEAFTSTLIHSIEKSGNTMLMILGTITFFYILNGIINPMNHVFLSGILEVSQGLNLVATLDVSFKLKEFLVLIFVSFGGLSIHLQIKSILNDTSISFRQFFKARVLQCIFSIVLVFL